MEQYGKILLIAMPVFLLLVIGEKIYGYIKGNDTVEFMDMISSLSSGITNIVKDVLGLSVTVLAYSWLVNHIAVFHIESGFWVVFIAFIALDFHGYWVHRLSHEINLFWNKHAIHHSSEEFNLACALRQSVSSFVNLFTIFLLPAALLGIPSEVIATIAPLHLFAQFWYHTRHIDKMGFLEKIIVTPLITAFIMPSTPNIWIKIMAKSLLCGTNYLEHFNQNVRILNLFTAFHDLLIPGIQFE